MKQRGIPSVYRNPPPPTLLDQIKANLKKATQVPEQVASSSPYESSVAVGNSLGTGQQTITTAPTQIVGERAGRVGIKITNLGTTEIFIGNNSAVSKTNGDLLPGGRGQWIYIPTQSAIYAIVVAGSQVISYSEVFN
jgi:hypothetical protein